MRVHVVEIWQVFPDGYFLLNDHHDIFLSRNVYLAIILFTLKIVWKRKLRQKNESSPDQLHELAYHSRT